MGLPQHRLDVAPEARDLDPELEEQAGGPLVDQDALGAGIAPQQGRGATEIDQVDVVGAQRGGQVSSQRAEVEARVGQVPESQSEPGWACPRARDPKSTSSRSAG